MLSPDEIRAHLATVTYRPGWTFTLHYDPWEGQYVRFVAEGLEDSYGGTIDIGFNTWLPPMQNTEQLDLFIQWRLWRMESHESREFFQRDGRPVFDPHLPR